MDSTDYRWSLVVNNFGEWGVHPVRETRPERVTDVQVPDDLSGRESGSQTA